jgi:protein subunit release factor B
MTMNFGITEQKAEVLRQRMKACGLCESDLQETFVRSRGPGGQKVNRTSTCVYLKHLPTGLDVKMQESRSQLLNRYYARRRLCELLEARLLGDKSPQAAEQEKIRKQKARRRRRSRSSPADQSQ